MSVEIVSGSSTDTQPVPSTSTMPSFDATRLAEYNAQLASATPQEILAWAIDHLGRDLWQTTAFGLTGLAATDMVSRISKRRKSDKHLVPMIFIDTLYHFKETLALIDRVERKYNTHVHIFTPPDVSTVDEFEDKYGRELWKSDEDTYDYLVKVEPARRAYAHLNVKAVITGRRRSQGADRATLEPLELDSTGLVKVNPLCRWSFDDVKSYIDMAGVPYNELLDRGYKSVGDWHSTALPSEAGDERSGRWAGDKNKTECGLHKDYFKMKKAFEKKKRERELAEKDKARDEEDGDESVDVAETSVKLDELGL
ncbi:3'-phosphoadenylsulfate reductase [Microbotryomycetes sp. JL201]|nr:3'-phosphoadenylsulfate reductase [Microbotryomycetes sp. JL201]